MTAGINATESTASCTLYHAAAPSPLSKKQVNKFPPTHGKENFIDYFPILYNLKTLLFPEFLWELINRHNAYREGREPEFITSHVYLYKIPVFTGIIERLDNDAE